MRPEKLEFDAADALVRGRVSARVFLGNHWLFQVDTPLGTLQITQANVGLPQAAEGDEVGLGWCGRAMHASCRAGSEGRVNEPRNLLPYWLTAPGVLVMLAFVALPWC